MTDIIRRIRTIIGKETGSNINIQFYPTNEVVFLIYESEVPLIVDLKDESVYLDAYQTNNHLDSTMLEELSRICSMLEKNIKEIKECLD